MKKVKALSLLILMLMSTCILMHPQVKAAEASPIKNPTHQN